MLYKHFVGTGFFEETVKALPLLVILFARQYMSPAMRAKFRIEEPLDGILLGAAAGGGFAFMETVGQYVSGNLVDAWMGYALNLKFGSHLPIYKDPDLAWALIQKGIHQIGTAPGVQLLIPRLLGNAFGHMAYSGLFGYFIGLSVLKPQKRWFILGLGLVSASIPHALWDSVTVFDSDLIQMTIGLFSYAVLGAAVLKAREISPNRVMLQPSVVFGNMGSGQAYAASHNPAQPVGNPGNAQPAAEAVVAMHPMPPAYAPPAYAPPPVHVPAPPQMMPQPNVLPPAPPVLPPGTLSLRIGSRYLVIVAGLRVLEHQAAGLRPMNPGGPVAEVSRNPQDPSILGLTNLSMSTWRVVSPSGTQRDIQSGQSVKLSVGTKIDFGGIDGEVR
jgi:RsiW-degrading membrane proteinase PrsW (M82 family)